MYNTSHENTDNYFSPTNSIPKNSLIVLVRLCLFCTLSGSERSCGQGQQPASQMAPIGITGNLRSRFLQAAVLLRRLDPVRGEPTAHGLDQDPHEISASRERLLKRKFLDSFALICAVKKDGDSVSAACMEEGAPHGTVIRIASNSGVGERTLNQLRGLVDVLNSIGSGGTLPSFVIRKYVDCWANIIHFQFSTYRAEKPRF